MTVKKRLEDLLDQINKASLRSGRVPADVLLIAVSKNRSVEEVLEAYNLGLRHFAESRLKEFLVKKELLPKDIVWHFIGTIQSNKALAIAEAFSFVHSVTSLKTAEALSKAALKLQKRCACFLEINLSNEESKQGFSLETFLRDKEAVHRLEGLTICGLMTMAPHTVEQEKIRSCFKALSNMQKEFLSTYPFLSMGMSSDFEIAIEEGSTHIRIGSRLFLD